MEILRKVNIWTTVSHFPLACQAAHHLGSHMRQAAEDALEPAVVEVVYGLSTLS